MAIIRREKAQERQDYRGLEVSDPYEESIPERAAASESPGERLGQL
jgi:hypothetical protein